MNLSWENTQIKKDILNAAVSQFTHAYVNEQAHSTAYRDRTVRSEYHHRYASIAYDYLMNTFNTHCEPNIESAVNSYNRFAAVTMLTMNESVGEQQGCKLQLPMSIPLAMSLTSALQKRRTIRSFSGESLNLNILATVLRAAYGISCEKKLQLFDECYLTIPLRTVPSSGELYSIELMVISNHIKFMERGIFSFVPQKDQLIESAASVGVKKVFKSFKLSPSIIDIKQTSAIILFVAKPQKSLRKYGDRGLRYVFQEVGSIAQNIHLASTALGLGSMDCSRFVESDLHYALGLDGVNHVVLHSVLLGVPVVIRTGEGYE